MPRALVWLQLLLGWLPIGVMITTLMVTAHPEVGFRASVVVAVRMMVAGAILGVGVHRFTQRRPWPRPLTLSFVAIHLVAASIFAAGWVLLNSLFESVVRRDIVLTAGYSMHAFLVLGTWLYVMIAGVVYATAATDRAARAEALAARAQLEALRAQLNPHFLFNALHTVVQLIPHQPARASHAAEQIAGLLRTTLEEDRDLVSLAEEMQFVSRYLEIESIRFEERLIVKVDLTEDARDATIPAFAVQSLVENAVRHGAAPNVDPTTITVTGRTQGDLLSLSVHNTGGPVLPPELGSAVGTGLRRLRDRLMAIYGDEARLELAAANGGGFTVSLAIPQRGDR
jgi:two-component sensor histidine kinase